MENGGIHAGVVFNFLSQFRRNNRRLQMNFDAFPYNATPFRIYIDSINWFSIIYVLFA
jgi:hypothetical protein